MVNKEVGIKRFKNQIRAKAPKPGEVRKLLKLKAQSDISTYLYGQICVYGNRFASTGFLL